MGGGAKLGATPLGPAGKETEAKDQGETGALLMKNENGILTMPCSENRCSVRLAQEC